MVAAGGGGALRVLLDGTLVEDDGFVLDILLDLSFCTAIGGCFSPFSGGM